MDATIDDVQYLTARVLHDLTGSPTWDDKCAAAVEERFGAAAAQSPAHLLAHLNEGWIDQALAQADEVKHPGPRGAPVHSTGTPQGAHSGGGGGGSLSSAMPAAAAGWEAFSAIAGAVQGAPLDRYSPAAAGESKHATAMALSQAMDPDQAATLREGYLPGYMPGVHGEAYDGVNAAVQGWALTANDHSDAALSLQEEAAREFGVENHSGWPVTPDLFVPDEGAFRKAQRSLLRAMYERSQARLAEAGITHLRVRRGQSRWDGNDRPLSSWTLDPETAEQFTRGMNLRADEWDFIGPGEERPDLHMSSDDEGVRPVLREVVVPASQVLCFPGTGFGCLAEAEVVVLADVPREAKHPGPGGAPVHSTGTPQSSHSVTARRVLDSALPLARWAEENVSRATISWGEIRERVTEADPWSGELVLDSLSDGAVESVAALVYANPSDAAIGEFVRVEQQTDRNVQATLTPEEIDARGYHRNPPTSARSDTDEWPAEHLPSATKRHVSERVSRRLTPEQVDGLLATRDLGLYPADFKQKDPGPDRVAGVVAAWAESSNDGSPSALLTQQAAADEFSLASVAEWHEPAPDSVDRAPVRAVLRVMYDETQAWFSEQEITHVRLFRGQREEGRDGRMRPLSSWTTDLLVAREYAGSEHERVEVPERLGSADNVYGDVEGAVVFEQVIPVARIVSTPLTGFGSLDESEFVVLADLPGESKQARGREEGFGDTPTSLFGLIYSPTDPEVLGATNAYVAGDFQVSGRTIRFWPGDADVHTTQPRISSERAAEVSPEGVLTMARLSDGRLVLVDGHHRWAAGSSTGFEVAVFDYEHEPEGGEIKHADHNQLTHGNWAKGPDVVGLLRAAIDSGDPHVDIERFGFRRVSLDEADVVAERNVASVDGPRRAQMLSPSDEIWTQQRSISAARALEIYEDPDTPTFGFAGPESEGPLAIEHPDGRLVMVNGHHRVVAAHARGESIEIEIIEQPADEVKHGGPGPHRTGTPQATHAGGRGLDIPRVHPARLGLFEGAFEWVSVSDEVARVVDDLDHIIARLEASGAPDDQGVAEEARKLRDAMPRVQNDAQYALGAVEEPFQPGGVAKFALEKVDRLSLEVRDMREEVDETGTLRRSRTLPMKAVLAGLSSHDLNPTLLEAYPDVEPADIYARFPGGDKAYDARFKREVQEQVVADWEEAGFKPSAVWQMFYGYTAGMTAPDDDDDERMGQMASSFIATWAEASNDANDLSLSVQDAAEEEFGIEKAMQWDHTAARKPDDVRGMKRQTLRQMYDRTQAWFAERGITEMTLYRGQSKYELAGAEDGFEPRTVRGREVDEGGERTLRLRPLSSWSMRPDVGRSFGGAGSDNDSFEDVAFARATVPVERILALPRTGFGCAHEEECVVLGGEMVAEFGAWAGKDRETKHAGPGPHPGTGTPQAVHRSRGGAAVARVVEALSDPDFQWLTNDYLRRTGHMPTSREEAARAGDIIEEFTEGESRSQDAFFDAWGKQRIAAYREMFAEPETATVLPRTRTIGPHPVSGEEVHEERLLIRPYHVLDGPATTARLPAEDLPWYEAPEVELDAKGGLQFWAEESVYRRTYGGPDRLLDSPKRYAKMHRVVEEIDFTDDAVAIWNFRPDDEEGHAARKALLGLAGAYRDAEVPSGSNAFRTLRSAGSALRDLDAAMGLEPDMVADDDDLDSLLGIVVTPEERQKRIASALDRLYGAGSMASYWLGHDPYSESDGKVSISRAIDSNSLDLDAALKEGVAQQVEDGWKVRGHDGEGALRRVLTPPDGAGAPSFGSRGAGSRLVQAWAETSNDNHRLSLTVQDEAATEFGLDGVAGWEVPERYARSMATDEDREVLRGSLRDMYERTQMWFAEHGVTEVVLYRGQDVPSGWSGAMRPLSSWSVDESEARSFAGGKAPLLGIGDESAPPDRLDDSYSWVFKATVPVDRILCTPKTGFGCFSEREMVVLGGPLSSMVKPLHGEAKHGGPGAHSTGSPQAVHAAGVGGLQRMLDHLTRLASDPEAGWRDRSIARNLLDHAAAGIPPTATQATDVSLLWLGDRAPVRAGSTAEESLGRARAYLRSLPTYEESSSAYEQSLAVLSDGSFLRDRIQIGRPRSIPMAPDEFRGQEVVALMHNHPEPAAPSPGDVRAAVHARVPRSEILMRDGLYAVSINWDNVRGQEQALQTSVDALATDAVSLAKTQMMDGVLTEEQTRFGTGAAMLAVLVSGRPDVFSSEQDGTPLPAAHAWPESLIDRLSEEADPLPA